MTPEILCTSDHSSVVSGKTAMMEKMLAEYLRRNPEAVVARVSIHGTIIEKPIQSEPLLLEYKHNDDRR